MHRQLLIMASTVALAVLATTPAAAQEQARGMEWGVESNTEIVTLPGSVPASVAFKPCDTCSLLTLRVDEATSFYVGRQAVSLGDLRRYASRGSTGLDVFYDRDTKRMTRVILRAELDSVSTRGSGNDSTGRKPE